jgi:AcrR family transcriptional regulator
VSDAQEVVARQELRPRLRRQREIQEVAARVFYEKGYEGASTQDIAKAAGVGGKGGLYYYISSKEDLLYEVFQSALEEARAAFAQSALAEGNALQKIRSFVILHTIFNVKNLVKMGVCFQDFRALSEERRDAIVAARDALYDQFPRGLICEGQEEGVICPDIDPDILTFGILGITNWISHWYQPDGARNSAELAESYADFVVAGLACDPALHTPGHRSHLAA